MDIISKSKPDLINHKTIKQLSKIFNNTSKNELTWGDNMSKFYNDYIKPNLFALIVFVILGIYLSIRYYLKQDNEEDNDDDDDKKLIKKQKRKNKNKKKYIVKYEKPTIPEKIFYVPDKEYEESIDINDDENSIHNLHKEYQKAREQYKGVLSDEMIREMYENKSARSSFDDLAKIVSGSN